MQKNGLTMNNEINNCVNSENSTQLQQRSLSQGNLLTDDLVNDCDINLDMTSNLSIDEEMEYFLEHTQWDAELDEDFFDLLGFVLIILNLIKLWYHPYKLPCDWYKLFCNKIIKTTSKRQTSTIIYVYIIFIKITQSQRLSVDYSLSKLIIHLCWKYTKMPNTNP